MHMNLQIVTEFKPCLEGRLRFFRLGKLVPGTQLASGTEGGATNNEEHKVLPDCDGRFAGLWICHTGKKPKSDGACGGSILGPDWRGGKLRPAGIAGL